ncbi:MAG: nicotinate (nicotinamide) nucleotide adenylyltransferase [Planctomycetota bacterium]
MSGVDAEAVLASLGASDIVLVFGGTFDPPHHGHLDLPEAARQALGAAYVAYLPAGRSPFKQGIEQSPPGVRLRLLRTALEGRPNALVLPWEVDAGDGAPTYTIDSIERLAKLTRARLRLLIGVDQAASFARWRSSDRLMALAEPAVMARSSAEVATRAWLRGLPEAQRAAWAPRLVQTPELHVSSTEIRRRVAMGQSIDGLCPPGVARRIEELGLYRPSSA